MKEKSFEIMIAGFTLMLGIQLYTLTSLNSRIDGTNSRIDILSGHVQDIDRRLSYLEGCWCTRMCKDHHSESK